MRGGEDRGKRRGGWGKMSSDKVADWRILVEATPVSRGSVASELVTHGSLESEAMANIARAAGVTEVRAEEGERVARGQVLAVLSSPSLEAGSERAKVELSQARRRFEQSKVLHGTGAISDSRCSRSPGRLRDRKGQLQRGSRHTRLCASDQPDRRHRRTAECAPGRARGKRGTAFQVVDLERLRVIVNMSEGDLIHLREDQTVTLAGTYDRDARATGYIHSA